MWLRLRRHERWNGVSTFDDGERVWDFLECFKFSIEKTLNHFVWLSERTTFPSHASFSTRLQVIMPCKCTYLPNNGDNTFRINWGKKITWPDIRFRISLNAVKKTKQNKTNPRLLHISNKLGLVSEVSLSILYCSTALAFCSYADTLSGSASATSRNAIFCAHT